MSSRLIMKQKDIMEALGVCRTTLWKWRNSGDFPNPVIVCGHLVGWRRQDIEEWLCSNKC